MKKIKVIDDLKNNKNNLNKQEFNSILPIPSKSIGLTKYHIEAHTEALVIAQEAPLI
jgi:hypothetical protein